MFNKLDDLTIKKYKPTNKQTWNFIFFFPSTREKFDNLNRNKIMIERTRARERETQREKDREQVIND